MGTRMRKVTKIEPIHEVELRTSHDVRRIRVCSHCEGSGFQESMIHPGYEQLGWGLHFHPQCYLAKYGFRVVKKLSLTQRDKFRVKDLNTRQMRRLIDLRIKEHE